MISKTKVFAFIAACIICMTLSIFALTPLFMVEKLFLAIASGIGSLLFIFKYKNLHKSFRNWIIVFFCLGILSTFTNVYISKTSIVSGLIGSLAYFHVFASIPLYLLLKDKSCLEKSLIIVMKVSIIIFLKHYNKKKY